MKNLTGNRKSETIYLSENLHMAKQAYRNKDIILFVTFQKDEIPEIVIRLKPDIFTDGPEEYCVVYEHLIKGIAGCGSSPLKAMKAFEKDYEKKKKEGKLPKSVPDSLR